LAADWEGEVKGTKVASIPHPYGTRKPKGWTPEGQEHLSNERAWHALRSDKTDRTDLDRDAAMTILGEIDRLHPKGKGGHGLEDFPSLRPMRGHVYARRRELYAHAKAAGLAIPEALDRPSGQHQGLLYDVLVCGAGVTSVKPGDCVVVNGLIGRDMGNSLGEGVYDFIADVPYVDAREYETERDPVTGLTHERRMSDCERMSGGQILAIVED
jgi:hypothetical protein